MEEYRSGQTQSHVAAESRVQQSWSAQVLVKWSEHPAGWQGWDWSQWKEVESVWSAMGEWDMILWVNVTTPGQLEDFVHHKVATQPWVSSTKSSWNKRLYVRDE